MLRAHGRLASGQGVATDILEASARAYIRAMSNALEGAAVREAEGLTADAASAPARPARRGRAALEIDSARWPHRSRAARR